MNKHTHNKVILPNLCPWWLTKLSPSSPPPSITSFWDTGFRAASLTLNLLHSWRWAWIFHPPAFHVLRSLAYLTLLGLFGAGDQACPHNIFILNLLFFWKTRSCVVQNSFEHIISGTLALNAWSSSPHDSRVLGLQECTLQGSALFPLWFAVWTWESGAWKWGTPKSQEVTDFIWGIRWFMLWGVKQGHVSKVHRN